MWATPFERQLRCPLTRSHFSHTHRSPFYLFLTGLGGDLQS